jgi:transposase
MARKTKFTQEEISRAQLLRDKAKTTGELRKALSVLLMTEASLDANKTAEILGLSKRTIYRNRSDLGQPEKAGSNTWGGRRHCRMTLEEENEFLQPWEDKAKAGGVLSVPHVHAALMEKLGCDVDISTTYRLLARHGWRKVQPDTKHPKSDPASQAEFKKNFPSLWQPPVRRIKRAYRSD